MLKRRRKPMHLQTIYPYDEEKDTYYIELSLDDYDELFNGWDASPLKRRDLEPELLAYLEEACYDIPSRSNIEVHCVMLEAKKDARKERKSLDSFAHNFNMTQHFIRKEINQNMRKIGIYISLSIFFLTFAYLMPRIHDLDILFSILVEGLFIGGWVMLWEVFTLFFFDGYELRIRKKQVIRLSNSTIKFIYKKL